MTPSQRSQLAGGLNQVVDSLEQTFKSGPDWSVSVDTHGSHESIQWLSECRGQHVGVVSQREAGGGTDWFLVCVGPAHRWGSRGFLARHAAMASQCEACVVALDGEARIARLVGNGVRHPVLGRGVGRALARRI